MGDARRKIAVKAKVVKQLLATDFFTVGDRVAVNFWPAFDNHITTIRGFVRRGDRHDNKDDKAVLCIIDIERDSLNDDHYAHHDKKYMTFHPFYLKLVDKNGNQLPTPAEHEWVNY